MRNNLAPIVLFVYNRPWHTQQTIESLSKNELSNRSTLFIYSDAPKDDDTTQNVEKVRKLVNNIKGFKKVNIVEREKNFGLADSITNGVTEVINEFGKIIVLEDDMVTSRYFLNFMNEALNYYEEEQRVWHISGWNYPIKHNEKCGTFLWRLMNCWGWGTWADKWKYYEKDIDKLIKRFTKEDIRKINLDGVHDSWVQVALNKNNKISTWAIFWYAAIFKEKGLCLNPVQTFVKNIGSDGSGLNCGNYDPFTSTLNDTNKFKFEDNIIESELFTEKVKQFYKTEVNINLYKLVIKKIKKRFGGFNENIK